MLNKIIYLIFLLTFSSGFDYKKEIEDIKSVNKVIIPKDIEEQKDLYNGLYDSKNNGMKNEQQIILKNELGDDSENQIINSDTFKCHNTKALYTIKYNEDKKYIYLLTNDESNTYLGSYSIKIEKKESDFYEITRDTNLKIDPYDKKICFELKYIKEGTFVLEKDQKLELNIFTSTLTASVDLINLKESYNYTMTFESEKDNIDLWYLYLNHNKKTFEKVIKFVSYGERVNVHFGVELKNENITDKLTVSLIEIKNYDSLVQFASYCAYACFAIVLLPIVVAIFFMFNGNCDENCLVLVCGVAAYLVSSTKISSVYLCKRKANK